MEKTKYRIVSVWGDHYLEYQIVKKLFWLIPIKIWRKIPVPYCDRYTGATGGDDVAMFKKYINSYTVNLEKFVKTHPDVKTYLTYAREEQLRLEKIHKEFKDKFYGSME